MNWTKLLESFFVILFFVLGFAISQVYNSYNPYIEIKEVNKCSTQAKIAGLWLPDIKYLSNYTGRFICISIDENRNLEELERTCKHEIGHEIFARSCENNFDKCLEATK